MQVGVVKIVFLAILGIVGAWCAFALALSGATRTKNPQAALLVMPNESTALAASADSIFSLAPLKPSQEVRTKAIAALGQQAINAKAIRLLGYYFDAEGDSKKAERFIRLAAKLSRREVGAQLWLIEKSARSDDIPQTLAHYDIALRTTPIVKQVLFPRLLAALEVEGIRNALKPYISGKGEWANDFLVYATENGKDLRTLVDITVESGGLRNKKIAKIQELALLSRLVVEGYFGEARRLYLEMPGASKKRLEDVGFATSDRDGRYGPLGWKMIDDPDAGGGFSILTGAKQVSLSVFANAATTRPVASKLIFLAKGRYKLVVQLAEFDDGNQGYLRWQLRCPTSQSKVPVWSLDSTDKATEGIFTIGASCPVQYLDLIASGGEGQTGLEATIASVSVVRVE